MNEAFETLVDAIRNYIMTQSPDHYSHDEAEKLAREYANKIDDEM